MDPTSKNVSKNKNIFIVIKSFKSKRLKTYLIISNCDDKSAKISLHYKDSFLKHKYIRTHS